MLFAPSRLVCRFLFQRWFALCHCFVLRIYETQTHGRGMA